MALRTLITERQRRLGAELKKLRLQAGLSIAEGGKLIGMGAPHLSHIEAGRTAIPTDRLRELVDAYGCKNEPYVDELVSMAESDGKGWWSAYRRSFPQSALDLAELESRATTMQSYETLLIPGLLQTDSYMRALFQSTRPDAARDEIDSLVRFRKARQDILSTEPTTTFHAVIHEAALRMEVGGSHVMRGQLTHLIRASTLPGVTIQVLPFEMGVRGWFSTPFLLLSTGVPGLETVVADHPSARMRLGDAESITHYGATFKELSEGALPPVVANESPVLHEKRDSWGLIQHILYTH
ncbi:helix-turn-helix domain-containing protein [Streptomyces hygroscopicus]|uniref:helix-turn-helix domain-containing protein n=1 Tax=Streptomyces hygroscopicus TaxID=1912 RepID=UPI00367BEC35